MGTVNSPRPCAVCGIEFYPSVSQSLFVCDSPDCKKEFNGVMDEISDNQQEIKNMSKNIDGLMKELVADLSDDEKKRVHSEMTKRLVGDFVEGMARNDCLFEMGGKVEAQIVTGSGQLVYTVVCTVEPATDAQREQWEKELAKEGLDE